MRVMPLDARPVSATGASIRVSKAVARPLIHSRPANQSRRPGPAASGSTTRFALGLVGSGNCSLASAAAAHAVYMRRSADDEEVCIIEH
jgi:phosphate starvation-inducible protein PhoH